MSSRYALWGRVGAHQQHARHDPTATTLPARRAFLDRFEREADPDGTLPLAERARRAQHLRRAYFLRLALRSAEVRRQRTRRRQRQNGGQAS
jgi:hypothetical protein